MIDQQPTDPNNPTPNPNPAGGPVQTMYGPIDPNNLPPGWTKSPDGQTIQGPGGVTYSTQPQGPGNAVGPAPPNAWGTGGGTPNPTTYTPPTFQTPPPPAGGGAPPASGPSPFAPFNVPYQPLSGTPGSWTPMPTAPTFNAPTMAPIPTWTDPTAAQAAAQPGYQFAAQQGEQALQQSQAAQGLVNTGGSLKDILAWGQNYATQNYGNVRNQMKDTYNTNVQNQIVTPYQNAYTAAKDTFASQDQTWATDMSAIQNQNQFLTNANFQKWLQDYNIYNGGRNMAYQLLTAQ